MNNTAWANATLNARPITMKQVWGEAVEWREAETPEERREERQDVLYFALCWLGYKTRLALPLVGCAGTVTKIEARLVVWRAIFEAAGVPFRVACLANGSNHEKPHKVAAALKLGVRYARLDAIRDKTV